MTGKENEAKQYGQIVARAWTDEAFKKRLFEDPKAVLAEFGVRTDDKRDIRVVENSESVFYLVIPQKPGNLSAEHMDDEIAPDCVVTECDTCATHAIVDR